MQRRASSAWLFGRAPDLALGAGGLWLLFLAVVAVVGRGALLEPTGAAALALIVGGPHYGATLLRAYGSAEARARHRGIGTHATVALGLLLLASLRVPSIGAALVTLYFAWVPWHYSAQCYGVTRIFLARQGVKVDDLSRRALHASFVASAALAMASTQTERAGRTDVATADRFAPFTLDVPIDVGVPIVMVLAAVMLAALVVAALRLRAAGASPASLLPAALLAVTHLTWFALPIVAIRAGALQTLVPFGSGSRRDVFTVIALTHAAQHLWVALHHARKNDEEPLASHALRATAAGALVWCVPSLVLGPPFTALSHDLGLSVLIAAAVNVHHFALDGVVWKLRDPRNSALVRDAQVSVPTGPGSPRRPWPHAPWVLAGAAALAVQLLTLAVGSEVSAAAATGDGVHLERMAVAARWLGRDGPRLRAQLAAARLAEGRCREAADAVAGMPADWPIEPALRAAIDGCAATPAGPQARLEDARARRRP